MTPTQPGDGAVNITVDSTDLTTNPANPTAVGLNGAIQRIVSFYREFELLTRELAITKQAWAAEGDCYMTLLAEFQAERELRTNAQFERDAAAVKLKAFGVLLQRVLDADANCTGEAYAQLIEDVKAALEVQS